METTSFKKGQQVRDRYGKVWTVAFQKNECQVFVYGLLDGWFHPANLRPLN